MTYIHFSGAGVAQSVQGLGYGSDSRGSVSGRGSDGIFLFSTQTGSGLIQPPIQWAPLG